MTFMRHLFLAGGAAVLCGVAVAQQAAPLTLTLNIEPLPIRAALEQFAGQTGLQIVLRDDDAGIDGLSASRLVGTFTADDALKKLLANTHLTYEFVNARTIRISSTRPGRNGGSGPPPTSDAGRTGSGVMRLARAEAIQPQAADRNSTPTVLEEITVTVPEVLVKGTRSINADIRRTEDDTQPYVVFKGEDIQQSQATTLEEFFKTRLPMNALQSANSQSPNLGNQSSIDLRGLGTNQTLILVDGRRIPSLADLTAVRQGDINGIPLALIDRVEVLPATASGIYGGGATGGVINIITRKDFAGVELNAGYGNTFHADAANRKLDATVGLNLEEGRTHIALSASHAWSDPLFIGDRNFPERGRALQLANNPAAIFGLATPPSGFTSNIRSATGANLVLKDGTPLNSPFTYIPVGYGGPATDGGAALVANAGSYNLDLPQDPGGARQSLLAGTNVNSVLLNARREFGARVEAFVDFGWLDNDARAYFSSPTTSATLQPGAPNNPFTTPIVVRFPATGLSFPYETSSETVRGTGGVIVRLGRDWTAAADYAWTRGRVKASYTSLVLGDPDGPSGQGLSVVTALQNGTLDVMRDLNALPLDWSDYLLPSPNGARGPADTVLKDATLRLSGPVFTLPAGRLTLSGLVERREEDSRDQYLESTSSNAVRSFTVFPARSQEVTSWYLEAQVPLISQANALTFARELQLQASIRRDEYETLAPSPANASVASRESPLPPLTYNTNERSATRHTLGLRYSPMRDVVLRASYGTGFLPPTIAQIVPAAPSQRRDFLLVDPKRENAPTPLSYRTTFGGNPDLVPEESESWSAGAIFTPRFAPELRLSLDYTRIRKTNEITVLTEQELLNLEDQIPGHVARDPLTPEDAARGYTSGVITEIDWSSVNVATTELGAWDLQADYSWDGGRFGDFQLYAVASWQPSFERQTLPGGPVTDRAGFNFSALEWRGNAGVSWSMRDWTLGWNAQYFDSYFVYQSDTPLASRAALVLSQGSEKIPRQTYHDVFVRYRSSGGSSPASGLLDDTDITLAVQNVFDKKPPALATTDAVFGYSAFGDPRLRRFSLTVRKHF